MTAAGEAGGHSLRRAALFSVVFAAVSIAATLVALTRLPSSTTGQWIIAVAGAVSSVSAIVFGEMTRRRRPRARSAGFAAVVGVMLNALVFALLAFAAPGWGGIFGAWTLVQAGCAIMAFRLLVRWPTGDEEDEPKSPLRLFISYRRQDSAATVGRIHDYLKRSFEGENIFLDVEESAGEIYRATIRDALANADAVLAIVGPQWITIADDEGRRRLDNPDDLVRIEIEQALLAKKLVIPVLVENASIPVQKVLPPSVAKLFDANAAKVRPDPDFKSDMRKLVGELRATG